MKKTLLFLTLLFSAINTYAQIDDMQMYYPENPLLKKLKVKSELDTIVSPPFYHFKKEFDSLGRQISWCYVEDSVVTRFRYVKSGDTLIKFHYYTEGQIEYPVYQTELFVYDIKGNILIYQSCRKNYGGEINTSECSMEKFIYDENFRLAKRLSYSDSHYKQPFSPTINLADSLLYLVNGYSYDYDKKGRLVVMKQMVGESAYRSTDSFFYDQAGRIIKNVSRQKQGFLGEWQVNNLCRTKKFRYETNRQIETTSISHFAMENDGRKITDEEVNEYQFHPNGLKRMWYRKPGKDPKSILEYLVYEFYR